jgi:hypothetical protein
MVTLNKAIMEETEIFWEERLFIHQPVYNRSNCEMEEEKRRGRKRGRRVQVFLTLRICLHYKMWQK